MMDEEIRQTINEVREMKKMCGNINMKLTNIVTQRGQNWKEKLEAEYQRGLSEGNDIGYKDGVKDGQNEAWEVAKKIFGYEIDGGIPIDEIGKVFGYAEDATFCTADIFRHNTVAEAIAKLKAYEEKQKADDKIEVGDEVEVLNSGSKYLIAWFAGTSLCGFAHDGVTCRLQPSDVRKTGRHFDIASILEEMRHD